MRRYRHTAAELAEGRRWLEGMQLLDRRKGPQDIQDHVLVGLAIFARNSPGEARSAMAPVFERPGRGWPDVSCNDLV
jgi:hypothetical protein